MTFVQLGFVNLNSQLHKHIELFLELEDLILGCSGYNQ